MPSTQPTADSAMAKSISDALQSVVYRTASELPRCVRRKSFIEQLNGNVQTRNNCCHFAINDLCAPSTFFSFGWILIDAHKSPSKLTHFPHWFRIRCDAMTIDQPKTLIGYKLVSVSNEQFARSACVRSRFGVPPAGMRSRSINCLVCDKRCPRYSTTSSRVLKIRSIRPLSEISATPCECECECVGAGLTGVKQQ